jgi:outer membrane receptor protein involved in Fe transport
MWMRQAALCFALGLSLATASPAQISGAGVVAGVLIDPSGAPVAEAEIRLISAHGEQSQLTSTAGEFQFDGSQPGDYRLQVAVEGFDRIDRRVRLGNRPVTGLRLRLSLEILRQELTVFGPVPQINTDIGGDLGAISVDQGLLSNLPILDLDYLKALSRFLDPAGTGETSVVVDGMEARNVGVTPSAIQEIRINQNPYTAEYPRWSRRRIEVITKTAADRYHGTVNFLFRNHRLNAREAFAVERPTERRHIWEGSLFGPLGKSKKMSFLLSALRENDNLQAVVFAQLPEGMISGNVPTPQRNTFASVRISRQHSEKHALFWQVNFQDRWQNNLGVGGTVLPEAGVQTRLREDEFIFNHSLVITPSLLSQFRILVGRYWSPTNSNLREPRLVVSDSFTGGGAQADALRTEFHTSITWLLTQTAKGHTLKYGFNVPDWSRRGLSDRSNGLGTYFFGSLDDYVQNRPFSAIIQQGDPRTIFVEKNLGAFVQDEWRIRQNLSVSGGLRYDWQNYFHDRNNFSPRLALAYGVGKARNLVLRAGAGFFYDRSGPAPIWDILRFDGFRLRRYVLNNPQTVPSLVPASFPTSVARLEQGVELPKTMQFSFGVERQLSKETTLAVNYVGVRAADQLRSRDGNAPLPLDFGARPDPDLNVLRWIESASRMESNSLEVTVRGVLAPRVSGLAQYVFGKTLTDTGGVNWFPADSFHPQGEWGRADTDRRHQFNLLGSAALHRWVNLGVSVALQSGIPFNNTTGRDNNRDGLASDRPPGVSRNTGHGPDYASVDLRWFRKFELQPGLKEKSPTVTVSVDAFNAFNRVNFQNYLGAQSSPFFGRSVASQPARRMQLGLRFEF